MTGDQILKGILNSDRELFGVMREMVQEGAIPTVYEKPLKKLFKEARLTVQQYQKTGCRDVALTLNRLMGVGNDLMAIIDEMKDSQHLPGNYVQPLELALTKRGEYAKAFADWRQKPTLFDGTGRRAN